MSIPFSPNLDARPRLAGRARIVTRCERPRDTGSHAVGAAVVMGILLGMIAGAWGMAALECLEARHRSAMGDDGR